MRSVLTVLALVAFGCASPGLEVLTEAPTEDPLVEFAACKEWGDAEYLTPEMIDTEAFLDDHVRMQGADGGSLDGPLEVVVVTGKREGEP